MTEPMTTALGCLVTSVQLTSEMRDALQYDRHPQARTYEFHKVFGAPIRNPFEEAPDITFSHMDDQRVAFRVSFILSELFELIEKGLGLKISCRISAGDGEAHFAMGSDNARLTNALLAAMRDGGRRNLIEVVDALGDLNVVVNGFALELGVDMRLIDQEILASNLTKLDENGQPIVADGSDPRWPAGKILKGPNYVEPQIATILRIANDVTDTTADLAA